MPNLEAGRLLKSCVELVYKLWQTVGGFAQDSKSYFATVYNSGVFARFVLRFCTTLATAFAVFFNLLSGSYARFTQSLCIKTTGYINK
ncbi:hypothetical protein A3D14_03650 [Candidatus Saccharibacteria bacterium RIFCSPHIGHO2_02_FULL_47_12]|nr:MAG: hypothetical protein A3D14_03650 [Candidatus Saccharibacteria bacterium RIFCSPHIGHO2_02_FULL_47_12]